MDVCLICPCYRGCFTADQHGSLKMRLFLAVLTAAHIVLSIQAEVRRQFSNCLRCRTLLFTNQYDAVSSRHPHRTKPPVKQWHQKPCLTFAIPRVSKQERNRATRTSFFSPRALRETATTKNKRSSQCTLKLGQSCLSSAANSTALQVSEETAALRVSGWGEFLSCNQDTTHGFVSEPAGELLQRPLPAAIDVHFNDGKNFDTGRAYFGDKRRAELPNVGYEWRHVALPLDDFLLIGMASKGNPLDFLKKGIPYLFSTTHVRSRIVNGDPEDDAERIPASQYEVRFAHACFRHAALALRVQRTFSNAQDATTDIDLESFGRKIDAFFATVYPRVFVPESIKKPSQNFQDSSNPPELGWIHWVRTIWDDVRAALFSSDEMPPAEQIPIRIVDGDRPLWGVSLATARVAVPSEGGKDATARKTFDRGRERLLLRLPEVVLHRSIFESLSGEGHRSRSPKPFSDPLTRWALINTMMKYCEILDPYAVELEFAEKASPQDSAKGAASIGNRTFTMILGSAVTTCCVSFFGCLQPQENAVSFVLVCADIRAINFGFEATPSYITCS